MAVPEPLPRQAPAPEGRWARAAPWLLALLFLASTLPGLGARDLWAPNEATHAEAAREMLDGGHWIVPHINERPYLEKPPLLHWLMALAWAGAGRLGEGWARLPSVLGGLLGVLSVWGIGRRLWGGGREGERIALWSGLVLATTGGWLWRARWIEPDALLAGLVTACLYFFLRGWSERAAFLLPSGLLLGLALLVKGPPALLPVVPAAAALSIRHPAPVRGRGAWLAVGAAAALALPLLWAGLATSLAGYDLAGVLSRQVVERSGGLHHVRPFWYYLYTGFLESLPWSLLLPGGLWLAARGAPRGMGDRFLLAWLLAPLVIFSLVSEKRGVYLLPLYPAGALLAGRLLAGRAGHDADTRWIRWPLLVAGALLALLAALLPVTAARELPEASGEAWAAALLMAAAAVAGISGSLTGRLGKGWACLGIATALGICAAAWGASALDTEKSGRQFAEEVARLAGEEPIYFLERSRPSVHFYSRRTGPVIRDQEELLTLAGRKGGILVVLDPEQLEELAGKDPPTTILLEGRIGQRTLILARAFPRMGGGTITAEPSRTTLMTDTALPQVLQLQLGPMSNFAYLFACPRTSVAGVVDPSWEVKRILEEASRRSWKVEAALLTHTHQDHVNALEELVECTGCRIYVHAAEKDRSPVEPGPDGVLEDGALVRVGEMEVEALHTPGHSPGALCYRCGDSLFTGDTLFVGRTGRVVFAGGSTRQMYQSTLRLRSLPAELAIYPGHDYGPTPTSTIGREARENAFLCCATLEEFEAVTEAWEREHG